MAGRFRYATNMSHILVPSHGPASWQELLAKPDLHWATGFSARTIAHSWEAQNGWPPEVALIIEQALGPTELLLAIPEHKTALPGGRTESQSDVFALGRHSAGVVACTIEGKVNEEFGPTVAKWTRDITPGRQIRFDYLLKSLGLDDCPGDVHYQLLHRTVSALIEADKFATKNAAMIVHSFSPEKMWFECFARFVSLFGKTVEAGQPVTISTPDGHQLILGWACGDDRYLTA